MPPHAYLVGGMWLFTCVKKPWFLLIFIKIPLIWKFLNKWHFFLSGILLFAGQKLVNFVFSYRPLDFEFLISKFWCQLESLNTSNAWIGMFFELICCLWNYSSDTEVTWPRTVMIIFSFLKLNTIKISWYFLYIL